MIRSNAVITAGCRQVLNTSIRGSSMEQNAVEVTAIGFKCLRYDCRLMQHI